MTKISYPRTHKGKSKALLNMSRKKSRRIIEIVTGQNDLHYIQNKVNKTDYQSDFVKKKKKRSTTYFRTVLASSRIG